jgi:hypothetical protein
VTRPSERLRCGHKGKKRHVLVDTLGLLLHAAVHPANIQDRDGGVLVLSTLFGLYPFLQKLLLMAEIRDLFFKRLQPKSCLTSNSKSSNAPTRPKGLRFYRDVGLLSALPPVCYGFRKPTRQGVAVSTMASFERSWRVAAPETIQAMQHAQESAGVEFIPENGSGAGVRMKKAKLN